MKADQANSTVVRDYLASEAELLQYLQRVYDSTPNKGTSKAHLG